MRRRPLFWQIFPSYALVILLSIIAVGWFIVNSVKDFNLRQNDRELESRAIIFRAHIININLDSDPIRLDSLCKKLGPESGTRMTVILPTGNVIADSDEDPATMDNHARRPEIQEAVAGRVGMATRHSNTLNETMMYVAIPITKNGQIAAVVRTATPLYTIDRSFESNYGMIIFGGILVAIMAIIASLVISRHITRPLVKMKAAAEHFSRGDFTQRLPLGSTEEMGDLSQTMNEMAVQLDDKIRTISDQRNEREAILAGMIEGVIAIDIAERIISLNQKAEKMLGVVRDWVVGKYLQEAIRNINLQKFVGRILESGEAQEEEIRLQDGTLKVINLQGTLLRRDNGQILGAVVVMHDITRLSRLEMIRRDFVANVSHELRTPITSIKGFIETLQMGAIKNPEDAERFLGIIARQTERMNSIIGDLLTLSELEQTERSAIGMESANLKDILQNAIYACESTAKEKEITIGLNCNDDLMSRMNAPLIEQAVINLIDNAVKYSGESSQIEVAAKADASNIIIDVTDHGCGIEKKDLDRIFERFYRVDRARSRELGGTGLGLSIVKHIILAHGGRVEVESTPGKGSKFSLYLPTPDIAKSL